MAPAAPGEPKQSPKPQPMGGNMPMIFLFTTCTLCFLFIIWRRASALRSVISHQLKTIAQPTEGAIRLSEDDGPPAREFLEDDYDDDNEGVNMDDHDRVGAQHDLTMPTPHIPNSSTNPQWDRDSTATQWDRN